MFSHLKIKRNSNDIAFEPIAQNDTDSESLNSHTEAKARGISLKLTWRWVLLYLMYFFASCIAITTFGVWFEHWLRSNKGNVSNCNEDYSPLANAITLPHEEVRFNGSLLRENIFRKSAGPEVDAAWEGLGVDYRSAILPSALAEHSGLLPSYVQVSEKYGGGFPVNVEGLHHLHCLNLLRKALYYNYDYYHSLGEGAFKNTDDIVRLHVTHCLDIIRQQLMCHVDTGVLGQIWWNKERPQAYPDFNTVHQCRDFETVRRWAEVHQAPVDVEKDYLIRPKKEDILESIP